MSIAKNIIDRMGGTIEVETAPGRGTEFIVELTLRLGEKKETTGQPGQETLPPQAPETENDFAGRRILLVEDNELNREIARELLEEAGLQLEEAEDGAVAVEKVRASASGYYDLILMDIQMPVMNGYEAAKAIRSLANPELAAIPMIAMTANAFEEDRQAALQAGMNGHLAKPVETDKMFALLREIMESRRA